MKRSHIVVGAVLLALGAGAAAWVIFPRGASTGKADPQNAAQVAAGEQVYAAQCARCHGDKLQGEPDWMQKKPNGRLPAPPHDANGHTWHHPDNQLFGMVKNGVTPYAPAGYLSDMPAFGAFLSDDQIWAVLAYIKSSWPEEIRERQRGFTLRADK